MNVFWRFAYYAAMVLALSLANQATAETDSVHLKARFELRFNCEQPFHVTNHPIHAAFDAVLNSDRSANADLVIRGVIFSNTVHFKALLGGAAEPAPGGASSLHVMGRNRMQAIWSLPNNRLILDIVTKGQSCAAKLNIKLKPGKHEYTMYDGVRFYYCSEQKLLETSCEVH